ncbi:hypothetical protein M2272_002111 [Mycobacterium frederiksbergense]|uniref:Immunity MXAN-0049 protein domain-containing protein n=1 Tax=Mycolicibacterium frederiksbergense TaxID=117567 RepID=A0ABT6KXP6_9MYCO|nr:DUF1629 domain-containing protein [Mycolicibacterium frederiksbergense]MDH6195471.1 hypothetical protein [Mycolicibacterium frederiksbergense]
MPYSPQGSLNLDWQWDEFDPNPDSFNIAGDYVYSIKHRLIDFDFWNAKCLASAEFIDLARDFSAEFRTIPVAFKYPNGEFSQKQYFYVLWKDWHSLIDLDKSSYIVSEDLHCARVKDKYFQDHWHMQEISQFVVDPQKDPHRHIFRSIDLRNEAICSESFMRMCKQRKMKGIEFVPIEDAKLIDPFGA